MTSLDVAIIGGGLSGLACARALDAKGIEVAVFDKGRGAGGRLSSRRTDAGPFDHGAPFLTARSIAFAEVTRSFVEQGLMAEWHPAGPVPASMTGPLLVGAPAMNAPIKALAAAAAVQFNHRIAPLPGPADGGWTLTTETGEALVNARWVVIATPAEQAAALLANTGSPLTAIAQSAKTAPRWTAMAAFDAPVETDADLLAPAQGDGAALSLAARDSAKPGRPEGERWVLHGGDAFCAEALEIAPEDAAARLLTAFKALLGKDLPGRTHLSAHRWRYALPGVRAETVGPAPSDSRRCLSLCGDGYGPPRPAQEAAESAWLSGTSAAEAVASALGDPH